MNISINKDIEKYQESVINIVAIFIGITFIMM